MVVTRLVPLAFIPTSRWVLLVAVGAEFLVEVVVSRFSP